MLPKQNRLRHRQDFNAVYRGGMRRTGPHLTLRVLRRSPDSQPPLEPVPNLPISPIRIGITISQKVSKSAVVRNQIKRQLRAACRQLLPCLSPGCDVIIVVSRTAVQCNYSQFLQELEQLLAQAEVLNGHSRGSVL